jgi:hypothetical protein
MRHTSPTGPDRSIFGRRTAPPPPYYVGGGRTGLVAVAERSTDGPVDGGMVCV